MNPPPGSPIVWNNRYRQRRPEGVRAMNGPEYIPAAVSAALTIKQPKPPEYIPAALTQPERSQNSMNQDLCPLLSKTAKQATL